MTLCPPRAPGVAVLLIALAAGLGACEVDIPRERAAYAYADRAARQAAACTPGDATACDDGNPCTTDVCDPKKGCQYSDADAACDDGDACTTSDACAKGVCTGAKADCDDDNACTTDACEPASGCVSTPVTGACDDGDACTEGDTCDAGACKGSKKDCDDGDVCTNDGCAPNAASAATACTHYQNTAACDDGDACTFADTCDAGSCAGKAKTCGGPSSCTVGQTCDKGACVGGTPKSCDDDNPCTADTCEKGMGCVHKPTDGACDDGDPCTSDEACAGGKCTSKTGSCDDGNACTTDSCATGKGCQHTPVAAGTACDDGDPCTLGGSCSGSKCVASGLKCTSDRPCFKAFCASKTGACTVKQEADGAACGGNQGTCSAGACISKGSNGGSWGLVPAGTFWRGCNGTLDKDCNNDEKPQHQVSVGKPYWMGLHEVTVAQYGACVSAGKCAAASNYDAQCNWKKAGREQHPINCVPWSEAQSYCTWVGGSLPTESQWEMAARGRCDENGGAASCKATMRVYPWGNQAPTCGTQGVFASGGNGCGKAATWAVGTGASSGASPYGMLDMAGNVWEWVADWSGAYSSAAISHDTGGIGPATGTLRAARGGAFISSAAELRASSRGAASATGPIYFVGFRCARPGP